MENKVCSKCLNEYTREGFYKDSGAPDHLSYYCKACAKLSVSKYRTDNKEASSEKWSQKYLDIKENDPEKYLERQIKARENYLKNKESRRVTARKWVESNPTKVYICKRRYRVANRKRLSEKSSEYRKKHRAKYTELASKRRVAKTNAMPKWLTTEEIEYMGMYYIIRERMSETHNTTFHVDHIVPLQGRNVCGLHVPWNLRVVTKDVNLAKNSKLEPALSLYLGADWYLKNQKGFNENNMY